MIVAIVLLNLLRFIGLEISPPGFYADESYGATQVICLAQTGADFFGNFYPLFSISGPGEPIYTPAYLYGQLIWSSIWGYSITSFRAFPAFVTCLTILFIYLYIRKVLNQRGALYVAFVASLMPWAFQFSRIAWDPPLAPFFLAMSLWFSTFKNAWWITGISLSLSAYSYPPLRFVAPLILFFLPQIKFKRKIIIFLVMVIISIPLVLYLRSDGFIARSNMLALWSSTFYNPYRHHSFYQLATVFFQNWLTHFSPSFLFTHGENNLRHSTQVFGMLSWVDLLAICAIPYIFIQRYARKKANHLFLHNQAQVITFSIISVMISIIPAALTNESSPHALRTISAWPFYAILSGIILYRVEEISRNMKFYFVVLAVGMVFSIFYSYHYFFKYPIFAKEGFESGYSNEILYPKLASGEITCKELRTRVKTMDRNTRINEPILFSSNGIGPITSYLNNHWHDREGWGIWSDGQVADLIIPIPHGNPEKIIISAKALVSSKHPEQKLEILINDKLLLNTFIHDGETNNFDISLHHIPTNSDSLRIEFRTPGAVSPSVAGISASDQRTLGIGLVSVEFK
jgi:4-amino-4-deoxy-L-arabinose transferase-like glycosyltransferase